MPFSTPASVQSSVGECPAGATLSPIFFVSRPRSASGREASSRLDLTARASGVGAGYETGAGSVRVFAQWLISRISCVFVSSSEPKLLVSASADRATCTSAACAHAHHTHHPVRPSSSSSNNNNKKGEGGGGGGGGGRNRTPNRSLTFAACTMSSMRAEIITGSSYLTDASGTAESHTCSPHV